MGDVEGEFTIVYCSIVGVFDIWTVANARWELKNPARQRVYWVDADFLYLELILFIPPLPCGSSTYYAVVKDPNMVVPAFAGQGGWTLNLVVCDDFSMTDWEQKCGTIFTYQFNVGESSLWETLNAPLYITYDGIPYLEWGRFSIALPSILLISSPFWILGLFIVALRLWFGSFRLGLHELRKAPVKLFRKKKNGGRKKNEVKKV